MGFFFSDGGGGCIGTWGYSEMESLVWVGLLHQRGRQSSQGRRGSLV